ncbi:type II toxin-antitoxin system VapC family toxin, partial [Xylella fastidiosa subsp. multiplex]|nr:type II toxin-antitoxin system VapC family toxin [Xylella fastidiosa subsp. multiplex]
NRALISGLRLQFSTMPFDEAAAEEYGRLRAHLSATGQLIGPNDMMIAAIALANRLILVTHNTAEFSRVPGLVLEDWQ